jgi:ribosomal protein L7/L12
MGNNLLGIAAIIFALAVSRIAYMFGEFVIAYKMVHGQIPLPVPPKPTEAKIKAECQRLINGGQVIYAIKHHREVTGSSLKDAKEYVDRLRGL